MKPRSWTHLGVLLLAAACTEASPTPASPQMPIPISTREVASQPVALPAGAPRIEPKASLVVPVTPNPSEDAKVKALVACLLKQDLTDPASTDLRKQLIDTALLPQAKRLLAGDLSEANTFPFEKLLSEPAQRATMLLDAARAECERTATFAEFRYALANLGTELVAYQACVRDHLERKVKQYRDSLIPQQLERKAKLATALAKAEGSTAESITQLQQSAVDSIHNLTEAADSCDHRAALLSEQIVQTRSTIEFWRTSEASAPTNTKDCQVLMGSFRAIFLGH